MSESLIIKKPKISFKEKKYLFTDVYLDDDGYINLGENNLSVGNAKSKIVVKYEASGEQLDNQYVFLRIIRVNGVNFYVTADYRALVKTNGNLVNVGWINESPDYSIIYLESQDKYLVTDGKKANLVSSDFSSIEEIALPSSVSTAYFSRRLFIGKANKIIVSEIVTNENLTLGIKTSAEINLSTSDGAIKKMFEVRDRLVIICENAVYSMIAGYNLEDLRIKRLDSVKFDYVENSAIKIGDEVYFTGSKNVYRVEKDRVDSYEIDEQTLKVKEGAYCGAFKKYYVIPLGEENHNQAIYYDTVNKTYERLSLIGVLGDGGNQMITSSGRVYNFYEAEEEKEEIVIEKLFKEYFDTFKRKYLLEIKVKCSGFCTFGVESEEAMRDLIIADENDGGRVGLAGRYFKYRIRDKSSDFKLEKITVKYRVFE